MQHPNFGVLQTQILAYYYPIVVFQMLIYVVDVHFEAHGEAAQIYRNFCIIIYAYQALSTIFIMHSPQSCSTVEGFSLEGHASWTIFLIKIKPLNSIVRRTKNKNIHLTEVKATKENLRLKNKTHYPFRTAETELDNLYGT